MPGFVHLRNNEKQQLVRISLSLSIYLRSTGVLHIIRSFIPKNICKFFNHEMQRTFQKLHCSRQFMYVYTYIYIYIKILFEFCYHVNLMLCREDVRCCMQWQNTSIADSSLRRSTRNWKSHATTDGKGMETLKDSTPMFFFNGFSSERCWWSVSTHTIEFLNWIL